MRLTIGLSSRPGVVRPAFAIMALAALIVLSAYPILGQDDGARGFMGSKGRTTFRLYCASCHGLDGDGDGPVAKHLKTPPSDLKTIAERYGGEFPREWVTQIIDGRQEIGPHGTREMPVWGDVFQAPILATEGRGIDGGATHAKRKIDELVVFLESIQTAGPQPQLVHP